MDEEEVELHIPPNLHKWFTVAGLVAATMPWWTDLDVLVLKCALSVLLFYFFHDMYTTLHFMVRNVNYRVKLRRYNLLDEDDDG